LIAPAMSPMVHGRGRNDRWKSWRHWGLGLTLPGQAIRAETNQKLDRRENQFGLCRLGTLL
jgi:hypothetical protein